MKKKGGGGVVARQLKKDWITAARKVSANTNSPWPRSTVWLLSEHPHPSHLPTPYNQQPYLHARLRACWTTCYSQHFTPFGHLSLSTLISRRHLSIRIRSLDNTPQIKTCWGAGEVNLDVPAPQIMLSNLKWIFCSTPFSFGTVFVYINVPLYLFFN